MPSAQLPPSPGPRTLPKWDAAEAPPERGLAGAIPAKGIAYLVVMGDVFTKLNSARFLVVQLPLGADAVIVVVDL